MDPGPPGPPGPPRPPLLLLLLTSLLHLSPFAEGSSSYIIDAVGLQIRPGSSVQSGAKVTLRCKVSVSHDDIPDLNHTFELTRDSAPVLTRTTTEDLLEYELNPARAADSGSYECLVTVKDKKKKSYSQTLDVTGLQTPILQLSTTQPFQSKEFKATCSAPEEKGALKFRFYQRFESGEPLKMKELASPGNTTETALVLAQAGNPFLYCEYDLNLVSFGTRRSNRSLEVQVVVQALFISPVMNVMPSPIYEGDVVEVVCRVVKPPPGIELFLKKDSRILKKAGHTLIHRFSANDSDSGEFMCKAEWDGVQKETYKSVVVKELFSRPRLTVEPPDIFQGDKFTLSCSVANVSDRVDRENLQFVIYKDQSNVTASHTYSSVAGAGASGSYVCEVRINSVRRTVRKQSAPVAVRAKVPVSKPRLSVGGGSLVLGRPFQLLCHSDAGSLPITYVLFGPGAQSQRRTVSRPEERAVFNSSGIAKAAELEKFLCHAKNRDNGPLMQGFGLQLQRSTVVIEPVSKPLLGLSTSSVAEGETLTLVCSVTHGTPPITFTWYHHQKVPPLKSRTSSKLQESYDISGVKREDEGSYYCVCTNPANQTKLSERVSVAVTLAGWKKGLIAVSCIVLVLMLVLGCVFKKRLRRYKRGRMGELSVKSSGTKTDRLSLTQAEFNQANATPGMIGKSIWSEHTSGSESEDQNSSVVAEPDNIEEQSTDPDRGVPELPEGQSVKYAELNHDADHHGDDGNHGDPPVQDDHITEADNTETVDVNAGACVESNP